MLLLCLRVCVCVTRAKSEADRDAGLGKSIHLPLAALEIKSPLEKTQCFGVSYGDTSIRIQVQCAS